MSPETRSLEETSEQLDKRLLAYALAAAGAVALTPSASAEIVYTPANFTFTRGTLPLDLNNDGIDDFTIHNSENGSSSFYTLKLTVSSGSPGASAAVLGRNRQGFGSAWDAPLNWAIGPGSAKHFINANPPALMAIMGCVPGYCWPPAGFWANRVNKFLGLRFIINGEVHYGWARFSVRSGYFLFKVKLSGYAYETNPDTTILAGDRGFVPEASAGSDGAENASIENAAALQPASLGLLSLGSIGLDAWREKQDWKVVLENQEGH
jgi:hypothetical protein